MRQLLLDNLLVVRFVYGLSFFTLGIVVALQPRHPSRYRLAEALPNLAAFAFLHAAADWGLVFLPLQARDGLVPAYLVGLKTVLVALSFGFLMNFGLSLLLRTLRLPAGRWLAWTPLGVTSLWLLACIFYPVVTATTDVGDWFAVSEVWARYLLGLPASLVTGVALVSQRHELLRDRLTGHIPGLYALAATITLYGLAAGLIVSPQPFWPASVLNMERFVHWFGLPVEVVRGGAGFLIAFFGYRLLDIFNVETMRRLQQADEERAVLRERERIARDLHDSILQTLYGVGLGLRQAESGECSPRQAAMMASLRGELGQAITELRRYVLGLKEAPVDAVEVRHAVEELVERVREFTGLAVSLTVEGFDGDGCKTRLPYAFRECVLFLVREGLSNVVRHSGTTGASVMLALQEDSLLLRIKDDGHGFDPRQVAHGVGQGLENMRQRTEAVGGLMQVESSPGSGTRLLLHLPLTQAPAEQQEEGAQRRGVVGDRQA